MQIVHPDLCSSVLFCTDCIFSSFLISSCLMWYSIIQPLNVLKYLISTDCLLFMSACQDISGNNDLCVGFFSFLIIHFINCS
jgi:hypothetical protein